MQSCPIAEPSSVIGTQAASVVELSSLLAPLLLESSVPLESALVLPVEPEVSPLEPSLPLSVAVAVAVVGEVSVSLSLGSVGDVIVAESSSSPSSAEVELSSVPVVPSSSPQAIAEVNEAARKAQSKGWFTGWVQVMAEA